MADPTTDQVTVGIVLFVVTIVVVAFFELKFLRKRMKNRRVRTAKRDEELPDEAHNAVVTTKAILAAMERQGVRSEEAATWLREADTASARRNVGQASQLLEAARARFDAKDYTAALGLARQSKRAADGESVDPHPIVVTTPAPAGLACPTCGSPLQADDAFCRKCGTRLVP